MMNGRFTRCLLLLLLMVCAVVAAAAEQTDSVVQGGSGVETDTVVVVKPQKRKTVFRRIGKVFTRWFKHFNDIDTNYIEPQHYNYTVMMQNTNTYEIYTLESKSGQSITFAPRPSVKIGPYLGWRWLFLGYTFDIGRISNDDTKKEFELSLYSSMFGIDLYYRKTGNDYRIKEAILGDGLNKNVLKGIPFSGMSVGIKGFNLYYIFNHKKFSYPAAFSQSTCQKRSCGSPLLGISYAKHTLDLDYMKLKQVVENNIPPQAGDVQLDEGLMFSKVNYTSYAVSGGYAYNWVFAKNWLFDASLSLGIAYKKSTGDLQYDSEFSLRDFKFGDFNIDGIGRFGLVWNNTKYYAGMSTVLHSYTYRKSQFSTSNIFGSLNIYVGINIGRK